MRCVLLALGIAASLTAAEGIERDPLKQPFATNSIWNTPIGSGAQYVAANLQKVPGGNMWASMPGWDEENIILTPTAPMTSIYKSKAWDATGRTIKVGPLLANVPMPANFIVPAGPGNQCTAVLMPDGRTITQFQPLYRPTAGGEALALRQFPNVDIYGPGNSGAHGGSDLSAIGGSIRVGELRPGQHGMRHALKVAIYATAELYNGATRADCYRWPATTADTNAENYYGTEGNNTNSAMKMGALLAIPASVDITRLGLETEPARQLAWTLQNYGAYVDDDTWAPGFCIDIDEGSNGSFMKQFQNDYGYAFKTNCNDVNNPWMLDIQRLRQALYAVNNNSPTSIGGGGTPRQPLAPPLADPAYPVPGSLTANGSAGAVRLAWIDPSSAETGFEIWRRPLNGTWIIAATAAANSTGWTDAGATAGMTWQYQVRLLMASSNASRWSGLASISLPAGVSPVISTAPANRSVALGQTASFTVMATGTPAPTYQWQMNGSDIAGATSASYTTPAATGADSGAAFRVVVSNSAGSVTSAAATLTVTGIGWQASYYDNADCTGTRVQRTDPVIDFAWGSGAPVGGIAVDTFSVRWRGRVTAPTTGTWTFTATADDGVRVWVGGRLVINQWVDQSATAVSGQAVLTAGQPVEVVMEYYDNAASASARLAWSGPGQAQQVIPAAVVRPAVGDDLPGGWSGGDVGSVATAGTISEAGGTWTVSGSGVDIWNTADGFAWAHRAVSGDVRITAEVNAVGATNAWAKAGVMVRESTAAGARHAFTCITPSSGVAFQRRLATDGASSHTAGPAARAPYWVRLERVGNVVISSCSANGTTWTEIRRETISMGASVLIGLAVSSHADGTACTATFSHVDVVSTPSASN